MSETERETEHIILVAFDVSGTSRADAERRLTAMLPKPSDDNPPRGLDSWWIAEDDRHDGSDNDSAVFVHPGAQADASALLYINGMTPGCNVVGPKPTLFEFEREQP